MKTIQKRSLKAQTVVLNNMLTKYGRVTPRMRSELIKKGYGLICVVPQKNHATRSGGIGIKHAVNDKRTYYGIEVCTTTGRYTMFMALVKEVIY